MPKLNTNITPILHRLRFRKCNPEKPPEDNYRETQWQVGGNFVTPQGDLYILAWEAEFGGHLFENPIIDTDPKASDFDESHTERPNTVFVPRAYFHDSKDGENRGTCHTSDLSVVHPSNPKSQVFCQDAATATDLRYDDNSTHASESRTDIETSYDPMQQPPLRQNENLSPKQINDPTLQSIRETFLVSLESVKTTYALTLFQITQKLVDSDVCRILFQPLSCAILTLHFYSTQFFRTHIVLFFSIFEAYTYK